MSSVKIISSPDTEIESFLKVYTEFLRHKGAKRAYLFGSRARGDHSPYSDIDILIVAAPGDMARRDRAVCFMPSDAPASVDVFVFTEEELRTSEFASRAAKHGRRLL